MKKGIVLLFSLFYLGSVIAQINLELPSPQPMLQDSDVGAMELADIDNDGDLDLMLTGKGAQVASTLYLNDGNGNFTEVEETPFVNVFGGAVGFEDVNNDGFLDLLITGNTNGGSLSANLYINDTDGNFTLVENTPFENSHAGDHSFGDIDNDGDQDVIITGINSADLGFSILYLNDGTGIFTEATETPFTALKISAVEFIDIENDDDPDVLLAGQDDNDVGLTALYINDGLGNFTLVENTPFDNLAGGDIAIADTDNDNDQDILISGKTSSGEYNAQLFENDGTGEFNLVAGTSIPGTIIGETDFADFDNDGYVDVLVVGFGNEIYAHIYENQGNNNFVLADVLAPAYLSSSAIGDVDGDGDLDAFIGGTSFTAPARSTKAYINETIPLPVELVSFQVKKSGTNAHLLSWQTASEENNDYFSIEHSTDEINFQEIAKQRGYGTTTHVQNYSYTHDNLEKGWHYYRIKQVDFDGRFEYSGIISEKVADVGNDFTLVPNPASTLVFFQFATPVKRNTDFQLLNIQGQVVTTGSIQKEEQNVALNISNLPSGVYYLRVLQGSNLISKKMIKY